MRPMAGRAMSEMNYLSYFILRVSFFNGVRLTFLLENVIEDLIQIIVSYPSTLLSTFRKSSSRLLISPSCLKALA